MESFFGSKKIGRNGEGENEPIIIPCSDISTKKLNKIPVRGV
jgi:hypothetical protein